MKKIGIIFLVLAVSLSLFSCKEKNFPDTVTIDGEYSRSAIDHLYPTEEVKICGNVKTSNQTFDKYEGVNFPFAIAYDSEANPIIYFPTEKKEEAVSYYTDDDNFDYYRLEGDLYDKDNQTITLLLNVDYQRFNSLLDFAEEMSYQPLTSFHDTNNLVRFPLPEDTAEIRFYKVSKDGAFTTSKGYVFVCVENYLYLLYQYDFADESNPVMVVRTLPIELNDYFLLFNK